MNPEFFIIPEITIQSLIQPDDSSTHGYELLGPAEADMLPSYRN
jgi:hypothetical protein